MKARKMNLHANKNSRVWGLAFEIKGKGLGVRG